MLINKIVQSIRLVASLLCLTLMSFGVNARFASPDDLSSKSRVVKAKGTLAAYGKNQSAVAALKPALLQSKVKSQSDATSQKNDQSVSPPRSRQKPSTKTIDVMADKTAKKPIAQKAVAKALTKAIVQPGIDLDSSERRQVAVDDVITDSVQPDVSSPQPIKQVIDKAIVEQQKLDQVLVDAQIDDVLGSAEFLALEHSTEFALPQVSDKSEQPLSDIQLSNEPEALLNQLDHSDLMDYVAEDDLWKEQLTIEDEP